MDENLKHLRRRFCKDLALPISCIHSPYFEERLKLLHPLYNACTKYEQLLGLINRNFDSSPSKFLEWYNATKDKIIATVSNSVAFREFQEDKSIIKDYTPIAPSRKLYTQEQDGCMFFSFDMKKANFQALKYVNPSIVYDCETYEDFIDKFTDSWYFKESKYSRQRIFGELNPKKTRKVEEILTNEFALSIKDEMARKNLTPFAFNGDEIIFKFNGSEKEFEQTNDHDREYNGVLFKFEKFKLHHRQFKRVTSDAPLDVYQKEDFLNGHTRTLKGVPETYFPQVYKLLNGIKINDYDLVFYNEHELCKFLNPIELVK